MFYGFGVRLRGREEKVVLIEGLALGFEESELEVVGGDVLEFDSSRKFKGVSDRRIKRKKVVF